MKNEERKIFWETLCSLDGSNPEQDAEKLRKTIKYPRFLYRYRPVNTKNLEALQTNRFYFSSANYYDDPFDTFLHIDIDRVERELKSSFSNPETLERLAEYSRAFSSKHPNFFPQEFVKMLSDPQGIQKVFFGGLGASFLDYLLTLRNKVREDTWSVCFSENGLNETLWMKYADQYKGFSVIYDLDKAENFLCGTQEKCQSCFFQKVHPMLYPLYYSDMPYDATDFSKTVLLHTAIKETNLPDLQEIFAKAKPVYWERERTTLIKKKCHHYDEEWRMITWGDVKPPVMLEWIPYGVVLGLRMSKEDRESVISIVKQAGIEHVFESFINRKNQLDARAVKL